jgi:predicted nucleotidyltransferase
MPEAADKLLSEIIDTLKKGFNPTRLILYGSRTNGTARPDSDYDFVMVLPQFDAKNRYAIMSQISSMCRSKFGVPVQVWVYSVADFNDWKDEFSSIPETALNTGIEVDLG